MNDVAFPWMRSVLRGGGKGGGGGGSVSMPEPIILTDPVSGKTFVQDRTGLALGQGPSAQDQLNAEIQRRLDQERADANAAKAQEDALAAQRQADYNVRLGQARTLGSAQIENYFRSQGLNPDQYRDQYTIPALDRAAASVPNLDPAPAAAFQNLGEQLLTDIVSGGRTRAQDAVSNMFTPTYSSDRLTYGTMDPVISSILDEQFSPVNTSLQYARDRGTLNQSGYQAALDALMQKRTGAESQIRALGKGIIDTDRSTINDIISGAKNTAASLSPTQLSIFDPSSYRRQADEAIAREQNSFGGELRSAIGSTKFADLNELLNIGGSAQGASQPSITNPVGNVNASIADEINRRNNTPRGLGNQGAF